MAIVEYTKEEKITNGLIKIIKEYYQIPESITCPACEGEMSYFNKRDGGVYFCSSVTCYCRKSAKEYIESKLKEAEDAPVLL